MKLQVGSLLAPWIIGVVVGLLSGTRALLLPYSMTTPPKGHRFLCQDDDTGEVKKGWEVVLDHGQVSKLIKDVAGVRTSLDYLNKAVDEIKDQAEKNKMELKNEAEKNKLELKHEAEKNKLELKIEAKDIKTELKNEIEQICKKIDKATTELKNEAKDIKTELIKKI